MGYLDKQEIRAIGVRLRELREKNGMTLDKAAQDISRGRPASMHMSRDKIGRFERGEMLDLHPTDLLQLAALYGVNLSDLSERLAEEYKRFTDEVNKYSLWMDECPA